MTHSRTRRGSRDIIEAVQAFWEIKLFSSLVQRLSGSPLDKGIMPPRVKTGNSSNDLLGWGCWSKISSIQLWSQIYFTENRGLDLSLKIFPICRKWSTQLAKQEGKRDTLQFCFSRARFRWMAAVVDLPFFEWMCGIFLVGRGCCIIHSEDSVSNLEKD